MTEELPETLMSIRLPDKFLAWIEAQRQTQEPPPSKKAWFQHLLRLGMRSELDSVDRREREAARRVPTARADLPVQDGSVL